MDNETSAATDQENNDHEEAWDIWAMIHDCLANREPCTCFADRTQFRQYVVDLIELGLPIYRERGYKQKY